MLRDLYVLHIWMYVCVHMYIHKYLWQINWNNKNKEHYCSLILLRTYTQKCMVAAVHVHIYTYVYNEKRYGLLLLRSWSSNNTITVNRWKRQQRVVAQIKKNNRKAQTHNICTYIHIQGITVINVKRCRFHSHAQQATTISVCLSHCIFVYLYNTKAI